MPGRDVYVSAKDISDFARRIGTTLATPYVTKSFLQYFSRKQTCVVAKFYVCRQGFSASLT